MNFRNPKKLDDGRIDCEVRHERLGWIPFTADPQDVEPHGRELHAILLAELEKEDDA